MNAQVQAQNPAQYQTLSVSSDLLTGAEWNAAHVQELFRLATDVKAHPVSPATQKRFRPARLARYSASSARSINAVTPRSSMAAAATPRLAVTAILRSPATIASVAISRRRHSATCWAPSKGVSGSMTRNSSPP